MALLAPSRLLAELALRPDEYYKADGRVAIAYKGLLNLVTQQGGMGDSTAAQTCAILSTLPLDKSVSGPLAVLHGITP